MRRLVCQLARSGMPYAACERQMKGSLETMECPLCLGTGEVTRAEILDRLGVKDLARVAQLSAEEAFRLLQRKNSNDSQSVWSHFETELTKRTAEMELRHRSELQALTAEHANMNRRVEDCLREIAQVRERSQGLETEMAKVSRIGKREEMDLADEARTWAGMHISSKLPRALAEPRMLIDNKDKVVIGSRRENAGGNQQNALAPLVHSGSLACSLFVRHHHESGETAESRVRRAEG